MENPINYFSSLTAPRMDRTKPYNLDDIVIIAISSIICGGESWNDMENFGEAKED